MTFTTDSLGKITVTGESLIFELPAALLRDLINIYRRDKSRRI